MYQKINDEKKICVCKEKCTRPGCVRAFGARPPHPRNGPDTTPLPYPNRQNPDKTNVRLGSSGEVDLIAFTLPGLGQRLGNLEPACVPLIHQKLAHIAPDQQAYVVLDKYSVDG